MVVRPKKNFKYIGWATTETLDKTKSYWATKAINQPDHEAKGLIFIGNFLLSKDDYEVVSPNN